MSARHYDVVVLGAGGAGLSAAVSAAELGASVLVLEAAPAIGGSTRMSAGVFYGAGTSVQDAAGVEDSVERMYTYYMALNQWDLEPGLVRTFCEQSAPTLDWLISLGVEYPVSGLYVSGVDDTPRGHQAVGGGARLVEVLAGRAGELGVEIRCDERVLELSTVRGAVAGVVTTTGAIEAGAVVLATGGFGANHDLLAEYFAPALRHGERWVNYFGSPTSRGDAIGMTRPLAAAVVGAGRGMLNWTAGFSKEPADFCPSWIVFVNLHGQRFMAENAAYAVAGDLMYAQPEARCYAILDEAARAASVDHNERREKLGVGEYTWSGETISAKYAEGLVVRADTLPALAAALGLDPAGLVNTIEAYNADADAGFDRQFRKPGELRAVREGPFYAVEVRPSTFGNTVPGLRIDADTRVLDVHNAVIPGLFAAGEASGGVQGQRYVGGGNAISNAIIFGRRAGRTAASSSRKPVSV